MSTKSMKTEYPIGYLLTGVAGTLAICAIIFGDVKWSWEGAPSIWEPNHLIMIMINVAIICSSFATACCLRDGRYGYAAGWFCVLCFNFTASGLTTLDRISSQKDDRVAARASKKVSKGGQEITHRLLEQAQSKVAAYCVTPKKQRRQSRKAYRSIVADYRSKCNLWTKREGIERALLSKPTDNSVGDALGYRVARVLGYMGLTIPEKETGIVMPFILTMAIVLFGSIASGWGFAGRLVEQEFSFERKGRAAKEASGVRYVQGYKSENGVKPSIAEVMNELKVTRPVAQRYLSKVA